MTEPHRLTRLLAPASVAMVGASTTPNTPGNDMVLELQVSRYPGTVYPVNPQYAEVEGFECYSDLAQLPEVPDLAVLSVGNERLEEQVAAAADLGVGGLVIPGSALLPSDDGESTLRARIRAMALAADLPIVGGNCMGFYNVEAWFRAFPFHRPYELQQGRRHPDRAVGVGVDLPAVERPEAALQPRHLARPGAGHHGLRLHGLRPRAGRAPG